MRGAVSSDASFPVRGRRSAGSVIPGNNDWLAEYCAQNPGLVGVALIALDDVAVAIAEVECTAKIGLRGAMIWGAPPPAERPYSGAEYDSFWAAVQDHSIAVSLHTLTEYRAAEFASQCDE